MMWRSVDNPAVVEALPRTLDALRKLGRRRTAREEVYRALYEDMMADEELPRIEQKIGPLAVRLNYEVSAARGAISRTSRKVDEFEPPYKEAFMDAHRLWRDTEIWRIIETRGAAADRILLRCRAGPEYNENNEIVRADENRRIYVPLFGRTFALSVVITAMTFALGFPIAYYLSTCRCAKPTC